MATAERLEIQNSMKGGISGIKAAVQGLKDSIAQAEAKAKRVEEERDQAKKAYSKAYNKQMSLRDQIVDTEEELRKKEEKVKDTKRRLDEKEQFLIEAAKFNVKLKNSTPLEHEVEEVELNLKKMKGIYAKAFERYQAAKLRKIQLEEQCEFMELKAREAVRRLQALQTELEYSAQEETRRSEGCKGAIDAAFKTERDCLELQRGVDVIIKRKEIAMQKINSYESKIAKVETAIDTINYDRRRVEATIKELLQTIKQQQQM